MPEAEMKLLRDEAEKRGKQPSVLAREILREVLNGPGAASVGRMAAKKAVLQKERKPDSPVLQNYEGPKSGGTYKTKPDNTNLSLSDRMRKMREE